MIKLTFGVLKFFKLKPAQLPAHQKNRQAYTGRLTRADHKSVSCPQLPSVISPLIRVSLRVLRRIQA